MNPELIPMLLVVTGLLIAYDIVQKYFLYRLIQKMDEKEREAFLALTRRR